MQGGQRNLTALGGSPRTAVIHNVLSAVPRRFIARTPGCARRLTRINTYSKAEFPFCKQIAIALSSQCIRCSQREPPDMIVCSCNVLSDHQIRAVVRANAPRMTSQVYGCLGCSAQCGRCARTIRSIMDQALAQCPNECASCPRALAEDAAQITSHDHHHPRDARDHTHHHHDPHRSSTQEHHVAASATV